MRSSVAFALVSLAARTTHAQSAGSDAGVANGATPNEPAAVVRGRVDPGTLSGQLRMRRLAATISDSISAEEMARSPDITAADSSRRIVGATVDDNRYLFVRGLGGRYTNTLLNGVPLPPLDPDQAGVQLDLFPSFMLDSIAIVKTFTPEVPADFAGGSVQIRTRDHPTHFTLQLNAALWGNTSTTFRQVLRADGGSLDHWGFDDGTRALPGAVPDRRVDLGRDGFDAREVERIGESFRNNWLLHTATALPVPSLGLNVGDTLRIGGQRIGYQLSLGYNRTLTRNLETVQTIQGEGTGPGARIRVRERVERESTTDDVLWGAMATVNWHPSTRHDVTLVGLWGQSATDQASFLTGVTEEDSQPVFARRMQWIQRSLGLLQLQGDHRDVVFFSRVRWGLFASLSRRDEPDTRDLTYRQDAIGLRYLDRSGSGERFHGALAESSLGAHLDFTTAIRSATLRTGVLLRTSQRQFDTRRFKFDYIGASGAERYLPPDELFDTERIGTAIQVREITLPTDGYQARQALAAPYSRLDVPITDDLRLVAGARVEWFQQSLASRSSFASESAPPPQSTERRDVHVLPAAGLHWAVRTNMMLRAVYGATVGRPLAREIAPFVYQDFLRRRVIQGNPALRAATIHNVDLRWEFFPGAQEVLAVSAFYKYFVDPIEPTVLDRAGNITYDNAQQASNYGAELEARISLGRLAPALRPFTIGANLALIASRVTLTPEQVRTATSSERPLAQQAPFSFNAVLGFAPASSRITAFVYYNVIGPAIDEVGTSGLPDIYQEPQHLLDAAVSWEFAEGLSVRFVARNMLNQAEVITAGGIELLRVAPVTTFALRLSGSF